MADIAWALAIPAAVALMAVLKLRRERAHDAEVAARRAARGADGRAVAGAGARL